MEVILPSVVVKLLAALLRLKDWNAEMMMDKNVVVLLHSDQMIYFSVSVWFMLCRSTNLGYFFINELNLRKNSFTFF